MPTTRFRNDIIEGLPAEAIKDGRVFRSFFSGTLGQGSTKSFLLRTSSDTERVFLRDLQIVSSDAPLLGEIKGGANVTNNGTEAATFNINLLSNKTSLTRLYEDPVYTGGMLRDVELIPAGSLSGNNVASGSSNFTLFMRILPPAVEFVLDINNIGSNTATYVVKAVWEEVP